MKVSVFSMISMMVTIVVIFGLPFVFFWIFRKKTGIFRAMAAGSMAFFVAQYVVRIPIMNRVLVLEPFAFVFDSPILYAIILAVTAAFFELVFRILVLRYFIPDIQKKHHILAVGFGHGMIEAILLVGLSYVNNLIVSFLINSNRVSEIVSETTDATLVDQMVNTLVNTSSWVFLVGGIERVLMIGIHMALTILAFKGLKHPALRLKYWGSAFLIHFVLDFSVVVFQLANLPVLLIELVIVGFAVLAWFIIKKYWNEPEVILKKDAKLFREIEDTV
jgi:uncharacterized membrane protein YhfC